jgi:predicted metal-dependent hydrolase
MEKISFGSKHLKYRIRRGKRKKTVAIHVNSPTQVIILAPFSLKKEKIREIVQKKAHWIFEKQESLKKVELLFPKKEFTSGEQVLFLGRRYRLKVLNGTDRGEAKLQMLGRRIFVTVGAHLIPKEKKEMVKSVLRQWYFSEAEKIIKKRLLRFSRLLDISPAGVKIRDQHKRWGSCSQRGILRFNWRIVMAPISILDYVVVHELCHIKNKNHSQNFWKLVSLAIPDYRKRRDWLKANSRMFYSDKSNHSSS